MFGKKKNSSTEEVCSVCGTTARLTKPSKLDSTTPPGILQINQHSNILAEIPFQLYICAECLDTVSGFIIYLMEEHEKNKKEKELMEKLKELKVGTVLTIVEEHPHPLPTEEVQQGLNNTPFSSIWKSTIE